MNKALRSLMRAVEEFRKIDSEMPAHFIVLFLAVASDEGVTMPALSQRLGTSPSSISRTVAALGRTHRSGRPGHDLLYAEPLVEDQRIHQCRLTPRGRRLLDTLNAYMGA